MNKCRICGNAFFEEPLLQYENMPPTAQNFPSGESVQTERGVRLEVWQCSGCGLVQLNNNPVPYYRDVIRAVAFSGEMKEFRKRQFRVFLEKYCLKGKKVIEVGCGSGEYLSIMGESGADAYGLEHLEESVQECLQQGLTVSRGFIESSLWKIAYSPFDAFFTLNYLEHLPDPNAVLRGIYNNLTEKGIGLVEVPNFDMILRKTLFCEFTQDHLSYFTKRTLTQALEANGFEILDCNEVWYDYIISAVVRKRQKLDLSYFQKEQLRRTNELAAYIDKNNEKVAVWGAGHQALAVISLAGLAGKIKYVVDSALFKQGKYTPGTHIPVVSPERLNSDPVEAVIVMAASYSDEVMAILKHRYGRRMNISVLRDSGLEIMERDVG